METILLPDGYNGAQVECYAEPLSVEDGIAVLAVVGSQYLIRHARLSDIEAAKRKAESTRALKPVSGK